MRKIFKVEFTGNYLVINEEKKTCIWVSKDQQSMHILNNFEKDRFLDRYEINESHLKESTLANVQKLENKANPHILLGKLEGMQQEINLAS